MSCFTKKANAPLIRAGDYADSAKGIAFVSICMSKVDQKMMEDILIGKGPGCFSVRPSKKTDLMYYGQPVNAAVVCVIDERRGMKSRKWFYDGETGYVVGHDAADNSWKTHDSLADFLFETGALEFVRHDVHNMDVAEYMDRASKRARDQSSK